MPKVNDKIDSLEKKLKSFRGSNFNLNHHKKLLYVFTVSLSVCTLHASEEIVFKQDFTTEKNFGAFTCCDNKPLAKGGFAQNYTIGVENDMSYLHADSCFGIGSKLKKSIRIDDSVKRIEVEVVMRNAKGANLLSFALSSRNLISSQGPFVKAKDSGFYIQGYQYSNQAVNFIKWRKEGENTVMKSPKEPFNFLGKKNCHIWVTWKLVYNHEKKQLEFTRSSETEPLVIQRKVDLSDILLETLWIRAGGNDYQKLKVTLITK